MKKSVIFLAVLPALMVLTGCGQKHNPNIMIEDTNAHNEIFGDIDEADFGVKHLGLNQKGLAAGDYTPVIGFQQKDNLDGTYSVRFVAAIESVTTAAKWYRCVQDAAGNPIASKTKAFFDVQTVYTSLNEGGGNKSLATDEIELDDDLGSKPFSYYAVYCLLNVPNSSYYVNAYCEITNPGGTKNSDVGVVNVANRAKHFRYSLTGVNRDTAFINGVERPSGDKGGNKVALTPVSLEVGDKIEVCWINEENLTCVKNDNLNKPSNYLDSDFTLDTENDVLTVKRAEEYKVYVNSDNLFYIQTKIYLQGGTNWDEYGGNHYDTYIQLKPNSGDSYPEIKMDATGTANEYCAFVDYANYQDCQFFLGGIREKWTGYAVSGNPIREGKNLFTYGSGWSVRS